MNKPIQLTEENMEYYREHCPVLFAEIIRIAEQDKIIVRTVIKNVNEGLTKSLCTCESGKKYGY